MASKSAMNMSTKDPRYLEALRRQILAMEHNSKLRQAYDGGVDSSSYPSYAVPNAGDQSYNPSSLSAAAQAETSTANQNQQLSAEDEEEDLAEVETYAVYRPRKLRIVSIYLFGNSKGPTSEP